MLKFKQNQDPGLNKGPGPEPKYLYANNYTAYCVIGYEAYRMDLNQNG